jgi:hypothetical protein
MEERPMSSDANIDPATQRVLATIGDEELASRYPNRTHFIAAENPHQSAMATDALFAGDPVAIVYADGHELLMEPNRATGFAALLLLAVGLLLKLQHRKQDDVVQFPPRARIEARDAHGHPIAA